MSNRVLITHNDFDGVTCAILFKAAFPTGVYYLENYDSVDNRIKQVLEENPMVLYITDISPQSEETIGLLNEFNGELQLFDHHKTALHLHQFGWATVETEFAGAALFYFFLTNGIYLRESISGQLKQYHDLTFHADDYDLWRHKLPHSAVLNSLLHTIGPQRFIKRFLLNSSVELTESEKLLLEIEKEKEEKSIQEAVETAKVCDSFAITFAEKYISQIGQRLLETFPVDIAVIVNAQKGVVSFRSRETDVSALAKALGGGGHPNAASFTLPKYLFHDEIADLLMEVQFQ